MDGEYDDLDEEIGTELLRRLDDVLLDSQFGNRSDDSPEEHMQQLLSSLENLKRCFGDDEDVVRTIDREIKYANQWVAENSPEEAERGAQELGKVESPYMPPSVRSVFDDIDADEDS